jgi:hypothetical protein
MGNLNAAITPNSKITTESTAAKMGRSMKNLENFIERFLLVIEVRRRAENRVGF